MALCSALLEKSLKGVALIVVGGLQPGGGKIENVYQCSKFGLDSAVREGRFSFYCSPFPAVNSYTTCPMRWQQGKINVQFYSDARNIH